MIQRERERGMSYGAAICEIQVDKKTSLTAKAYTCYYNNRIIITAYLSEIQVDKKTSLQQKWTQRKNNKKVLPLNIHHKKVREEPFQRTQQF